jgi:GMP synthase-like glutamine amidotransferase
MAETFTIGILETGLVADELVGTYSTYPDMFVKLLRDDLPQDWSIQVFSPIRGHFPEHVGQCDAWLVTGSKFGAYEDFDWIHKLRAFLADAYEQDCAIVGICFGHQILAEALGGKVIKSPKGWGCGAHRYEWQDKPDWVSKAEQAAGKKGRSSFVIQAYHQDQVIDLPKDAKIIARSEFCDYAALAYQDKAISFQGHPEFAADYTRDLFALRQGAGLPDDIAEAAIATTNQALDRALLAQAIVEFLKAYQISHLNKQKISKAG